MDDGLNLDDEQKEKMEGNFRGSEVNCERLDCVVYLHTHSACQIQGIPLREWFILKKKALCIFDFHASGVSEGKYTSFGYYETFDLDAVDLIF